MNRLRLNLLSPPLGWTLALLALLVVAPFHASAQSAAEQDGALTSGPLYDALLEMDRRLFEASFVTCDAATANAIFADDVEFYHDQAGRSVGEQVRENTRRLTSSCPADRGVTRSLVPGSLRLYPIQAYGAVQMGTHRFEERGSATSTITRFVHVWQLSDGHWRLARVLSLDHRLIPAPSSVPVQSIPR
jgi:hypothetical protein